MPAAADWREACRDSDIPGPGDYHIHEDGFGSVIVIRGADLEVRAFANECPHKRAKFATAGMRGTVRQMTCPLHGWTWALDGTFKALPYGWDRLFDAGRDYAMAKVAVMLRGGRLFVSRDLSA
jgi:phenylpropionate dioxygenase-like ring-hydroxylating dioxygenase large terminal subunit